MTEGNKQEEKVRETAEGTLEKMREALREMRHHENCAAVPYPHKQVGECNCGLSNLRALSEIGAGEGEGFKGNP